MLDFILGEGFFMRMYGYIVGVKPNPEFVNGSGFCEESQGVSSRVGFAFAGGISKLFVYQFMNCFDELCSGKGAASLIGACGFRRFFIQFQNGVFQRFCQLFSSA